MLFLILELVTGEADWEVAALCPFLSKMRREAGAVGAAASVFPAARSWGSSRAGPGVPQKGWRPSWRVG